MDTPEVNTVPAQKKCIKKRKTLIIIAAAVAATIVACVLPFVASTADSTQTVYIYPDMTQAAFADSLRAKFGDSYTGKILFLNHIKPTDLANRVGAYEIRKGTPAVKAWRKLHSGAQTPVKFTFNSVRTLSDFADKVDRTLLISRDEIFSALTNPDTCAKYGFTPQTIPAMLLPDTYEFYWTAKPSTILKKMKEGYDNYWTKERLKKAQKLELSPVQVSTLASIVEEESANRAERGTIARLYMNRLHKGMKLQSDPTVKFAVGDTKLQRITGKHLFTNSPYNTYRVQGLPPGPIRLPEKQTLNAVLDAPQNDYIYMCAKEDFSGTHNFTDNYADHRRNASRYQQELNRRGIK